MPREVPLPASVPVPIPVPVPAANTAVAPKTTNTVPMMNPFANFFIKTPPRALIISCFTINTIEEDVFIQNSGHKFNKFFSQFHHRRILYFRLKRKETGALRAETMRDRRSALLQDLRRMQRTEQDEENFIFFYRKYL